MSTGYNVVNPWNYTQVGPLRLASMTAGDGGFIYQESIRYNREKGRDLYKDLFGLQAAGTEALHVFVNQGELAHGGEPTPAVYAYVQLMFQIHANSPFWNAFIQAHPQFA